jgi:hypothetical protein
VPVALLIQPDDPGFQLVAGVLMLPALLAGAYFFMRYHDSCRDCHAWFSMKETGAKIVVGQRTKELRCGRCGSSRWVDDDS